MAYDLYGTSGVKNDPLFINLQPFNLDLSPMAKTAEMQAALRAQGAAKSAALQQKIKDLEMPDYKDAIAADTTDEYQKALKARQGMLDELSSGANPFWIIRNSSTFKENQRAYVAATAPDVKLKLAEEKKALDDFNKRTGAAPGTSGSYFLDEKGNLVTHPLNRNIPITAGEGASMREEYGFRVQAGGVTNFQQGVIGTSTDYPLRIDKTFSGIGESEFGSNMAGANAEQWRRLAENSQDPYAGVLSAMVVNQRSGGNRKQVLDAVAAIRNEPLSPQDKVSILNGYMQTPEFQSGYREGKFTDKDGLNTAAITAAALRKGGYVDDLIISRANRFLKDRNITTGDFKTSSGGKDQQRMVQPWKVIRNGPPEVEFNGQYLTIPIAAPGIGGRTEQSSIRTPVYTTSAPKGLVQETFKEMGILKSNGEFSDKSLLETLGGTRLWLGGGKELTSSDKSIGRIIGYDPTVYLVHESFGTNAANDPETAERLGIKWESVNEGGQTTIKPVPLARNGNGRSLQQAVLRVRVQFDPNSSILGPRTPDNPYDFDSKGGDPKIPGNLVLRRVDKSEMDNRYTVTGGLFDFGNEKNEGWVYMKVDEGFSSMKGMEIPAEYMEKSPGASLGPDMPPGLSAAPEAQEAFEDQFGSAYRDQLPERTPPNHSLGHR